MLSAARPRTGAPRESAGRSAGSVRPMSRSETRSRRRPLRWRLRSRTRLWLSVRLPQRLGPRLPGRLRSLLLRGEPDTAEGQWLRAVMLPDTRVAFERLDPPSLSVVEVTGEL